ncbi:MAG: YigZ family protein [Muribaculaceae bacterium]|nr:YigZ family protein [Muribaculaceae bacterium]
MSRFLAFAHPVSDAQEAKEIIARYTNEYHDARHVCWAYMTGADRSVWQLNDNGEPSGTAGKPILGQINSFGLTNVVIVVVRYFGGIKLGTPGLIAAYREAARQALEAAEIVEGREMTELRLSFVYLAMNDVMKVVKAYPDAKITAQDFDNACTMTLSLPLDIAEELTARLNPYATVSE